MGESLCFDVGDQADCRLNRDRGWGREEKKQVQVFLDWGHGPGCMKKGKRRAQALTQALEEGLRDLCFWSCFVLNLALENGVMLDPFLEKHSPNRSGEPLWIVRQTVALLASTAVGVFVQHWYRDFATSTGANLMETSTFSKGRLLGT